MPDSNETAESAKLKLRMKHIVGFSGGADSQACAIWVRQRFQAEDIILLNSDPGGNEHPLTTEFIRHYSETVFPVTVVTPLIRDLAGIGTKSGQAKERRDEYGNDAPMTFGDLAYIKGRFPSSQAQFCTEHLKLAPQRRWVIENLPDGNYERYSGVRRAESHKRRETPERAWDDYFDCYMNCPLATWSKAQVFAFIAEAGEEVNPLYRHGFGRVGCAPCINSGKEDVRLWAARFPEMIEKVRAWEQQVGRTFFPPMVPGMEINWVDDVVRWSKTSRGGLQFNLPMVEAEAAEMACSSKYGLCE